ncbi:hypothetical protein D5086_009747 [Populus alba]|uniref:Uncharacterized protein n=1 Tax=Populus alba TaxID=43335 RepID=A0ACC4C7G2_POPAL
MKKGKTLLWFSNLFWMSLGVWTLIVFVIGRVIFMIANVVFVILCVELKMDGNRWVVSDWKKDESTAGVWNHTSGKWNGDPDDKGSDHLFFQFSVKHEQKLDCGGGYMKLLSGEVDRRNLVVIPRTGWLNFQFIMFGPDICGYSTKKVHAILNYKETNHLVKKEVPFCTPDWDLLPPKQIKDPEAKKPEDWDDKEYIPDPEDKEARASEDWEMIEDAISRMNPEVYVYPNLRYVGSIELCAGEIWNLVSSNVLVSDDPEYAKQQWLKKHGKSRKMYAEKAAFGRRQKKKKRMRAQVQHPSIFRPEDEDETDDVEGEIPMPKLKKTRTARTKKKYMMSCDEKHSRQQLGMEEIHLGSKC